MITTIHSSIIDNVVTIAVCPIKYDHVFVLLWSIATLYIFSEFKGSFFPYILGFWAIIWCVKSSVTSRVSKPKITTTGVITAREWARCFTIELMMTSSHGNIFRVTGPLYGEFTGPRWIPRTKASDAELWCFLWSAPWINGWVNNGDAGDLRRHRAHYDVVLI